MQLELGKKNYIASKNEISMRDQKSKKYQNICYTDSELVETLV